MKISHTNTRSPLLALSLFILLTLGYFLFPFFQPPSKTANMSLVSNTLSSSRFSFLGELSATGNTVGSTIIRIKTDPADAASTSSSQLATPSATPGVVKVKINNEAPYTLSSIMPGGDESLFTITTGVTDITAGEDNVVSTQSAIQTVRFTTANSVPDGAFRVLIPATASSSHGNDGIPDRDGFDLGASGLVVTCPSDVPSYYDFVAGTATASNVVIGTQRYHTIECKYSGPGNASQSFQTNPIRISSPINPAPKTSHVVGTANSYNFSIQNVLPSNPFGSGAVTYTTVDETNFQVGVIESVRVSLTVAPQITFKIAGMPQNWPPAGPQQNEACGLANPTNVTTTPTAVPFGNVTIGVFRHAAQTLHVATNAVSGYSVTAQMNDNLGKGGRVCDDSSYPQDCIPDVTAGSATYGDEGDWTVTTEYGFGYTLAKIGGSLNLTTPFTRTSGTGCTTFCARQFADLQNSEPAQIIFQSTGISDTDNVQVCYRVNISGTIPAGDYENHIIYTATANF